MQGDTPLYINLAQAAESPQKIYTELHDRFFEDLDQEEIVGGDVAVLLTIRAMADDIFTINIFAKGKVTVACDRCLDNLELDVAPHEIVRLKHSLPDESDAPDMIYADAANAFYDLSWTIYEIIETALPMRRTHPEGKCNPEVTRYLLQDQIGDSTDDVE